ncbi:hypothetical protein C8J31_11758 [Rhizobium sp. PP-CC-2G-626]|nr:hypothetical protein C8J31_11758 [Rhizobium sp. PP-CC-2G-626]
MTRASSSRPPRRGLPTSGFLLVEALTAMAIGALLLVALGSLVSLVLRASDRTASTSQQIEETSRIFSTLIGRIETMTPQRWAGAGAGFVFEGTETALVFARFPKASEAGTGSRLVILTSDGPNLREEERSLPPNATDIKAVMDRETATTALLQQGYTVRFAYFSRLPNGKEALTDRWSGRRAMPVAIRIALADARGKLHGSVRVPIRVDAEPGCAAPGQGTCSLVPDDPSTPENASPAGAAPIDPDDGRGWERYVRP